MPGPVCHSLLAFEKSGKPVRKTCFADDASDCIIFRADDSDVPLALLYLLSRKYYVNILYLYMLVSLIPEADLARKFRSCPMTRRTKLLSAFLSFLSLVALARAAIAQTAEEKQYLLMYFSEDELVVESPTRSSKPVTRTAENVTVVTADDIRLMNAHTVAEVLNSVTGVQVFLTGGPGSSATASIQGSESRHVAVFIDDIPLNNLSDNTAELGSLPVQNIEKIEIVKGPASSAWGSALGGVINIITKSGGEEGAKGLLSASYGQHLTGDYRGEASGKQGDVGYYFTAGRLETDGFRPHNDFTGNNAYAKLTYDLTDDTSMTATLSYDTVDSGIGDLPAFGLFVNHDLDTALSSVALRSTLSESADLQISVWYLHQHSNFSYQLLGTGTEVSMDRYLDNGYGSSIKLTWKSDHHTVVFGGDYDSKTLESNAISLGRQGIAKTAAYINDTMTLGRLTVTPGLRYDRTDTNGDFMSPSLGMTYRLTETTILRADAARGFNVPSLGATYGDNLFHVSNPALRMEKVKSYQVGAETAAMKYVWVKISGFRHDLDDVLESVPLSPVSFITVNGGRERRQGMDIELRTTPVYHTSLSAGAEFINAKDRDTNETIKSVPQKTYDVGLQYDDTSFKALAKGHYIYWNTDPFFQGRYSVFVVDVHVSQVLYSGGGHALEAFADVHNLFNGEQYAFDIYQNPGRWFEAGMRYVF
jgi:vitamin B12 transporter